jgi:beta-lactamase regulating signal transducer with metallopeptidase domain
MTFADLLPLANHLWQSTLCAAVVWLLTLALRNNRAAVRYWLWLAASLKFVIPYSLLVSSGAHLGWRAMPATAHSQFSFAMGEISQPFAVAAPIPVSTAATPILKPLPDILFVVWLCGIAIGIGSWVQWLRQMRAVLRMAMPLDLNLPIRGMSARARIEPGVIGIFKPVLLLPDAITEHLTPIQFEAILAHELCHVRRQDNLTAALHMLVETIFWFHPLVWWIRRRLMDERERACDEEVVLLGGEPQIYAESILRVCEFYLASPVAYASGVTGGDLKKRIEGIMTNRSSLKLSIGKRILLATTAALVIAGPIAVGLLNPQLGRAQPQIRIAAALAWEGVRSPEEDQVAQPALTPPGTASEHTTRNAEAPAVQTGQPPNARPKFEVASVKRSECFTGRSSIDPGSVTLKGLPLKAVLREAFKVPMDRIEGPSWLDTDCFEIAAKLTEGATSDQLPAMYQALLAERFKLVAHTEDRPRPGYALVVDKGGPKFKEDDPETNFMGPGRSGMVMFGARGHGAIKGVRTMAMLASNLRPRDTAQWQILRGSQESTTSISRGRETLTSHRAAPPCQQPRPRSRTPLQRLKPASLPPSGSSLD